MFIYSKILKTKFLAQLVATDIGSSRAQIERIHQIQQTDEPSDDFWTGITSINVAMIAIFAIQQSKFKKCI